MERIVIINESTFVKWTKSVERLQKLLESQEQQVSNRKTTEWFSYRQKQILPYVLLGGKVLYRESDLQGILQRNYVPASRHIH